MRQESRAAVVTPVLTFGLLDNLDIALGGAYQRQRTTEDGVLLDEASGRGDSSLELKWRFYDEDGLSLAFKPGLTLPTGEKVSPSDLELAITEDPLFDQAMVVGEAKPYLAALVVLNPEAWRDVARSLRVDAADLKSLETPAVAQAVRERIAGLLRGFPAYARVLEVRLALEPWTIENGLITPTMKLKRPELERRFASEIRRLYAGHDLPA